MKNSDKNENKVGFEVGDIVRVGDSGTSMVYILTMEMPIKDPSYYQAIATNGSIATLWKGSIKEKLGHYDLNGMYRLMEQKWIEWFEGR